jgi:hypothetical protein
MLPKSMTKLTCAIGIAATAVFGMATPPAHATNHLCGRVTTTYAGGGSCIDFCATDGVTCFGDTSGDVVKVVGACTPC